MEMIRLTQITILNSTSFNFLKLKKVNATCYAGIPIFQKQLHEDFRS